MMAAAGTNPTRLARDAGLAPNTVSQFTNGSKGFLSEKTLAKILPLIDLTEVSDLDTDNPLADPRVEIRRLIDQVPEERLGLLLEVLRTEFPKTKRE
nr:helix-turn-helix domain-containing protein [Sagittula salina]